MSEIRRLTVADAEAFRALRIRALHESPEAFLEDTAEAERRPVEEFEKIISKDWVVGAFSEGELQAMAGMFRQRLRKTRHKATIWGVFTAPEARGKGLMRGLLTELINIAKQEGIELIMLSTNELNPVTIGLYQSVGFEICGREPHIIKIGDEYINDVLMFRFV